MQIKKFPVEICIYLASNTPAMMVTSDFFHCTIEQVSTNETNQELPRYQKEYKRTNLNCQLCLASAKKNLFLDATLTGSIVYLWSYNIMMNMYCLGHFAY